MLQRSGSPPDANRVLLGAVRLAKPNSPWAHHRYRRNTRKRERASARHSKHEALRDRLLSAIGGAPTPR